MKRLNIFCTTIKYYEVMKHFPSYIIPLGLGTDIFPKHWLNENNGQNISYLNKFYGELTGFFWVWKNYINNINEDDFVGFCHYRKLWLNNEYFTKQKNSNVSLYSKLLDKNNKNFNNIDVAQVSPIKFKNKSLAEDFNEVHGKFILEKTLDFLDQDYKNDFKSYLNGNILYPLNMFIVKKKYFTKYCEILFPWLENCLNYFKNNNLIQGYNIRLPAFLAERFTSFWFSRYENKLTLSYARLGSFFLSNPINRYVNTIKIPFTFRMYPTIHNY